MNGFEKINWTLVLGILGGIIVVFAAFSQWSEKKAEELKAEVNQKKADLFQEQLTQLQSKNLQKTEELANAYKEIANLQSDIKNQITGGTSFPYLKLIASKTITEGKSGAEYFIIYFSVELKGKYSLQNVKCDIYDVESLTMLTFGVSHHIEGLLHSISNDIDKDFSNFKLLNRFDLGTLTIGSSNTIYIATIPLFDPVHDANFNVILNWNNGSLSHNIMLKAKKDFVRIISDELIFNGNRIEKYDEYIGIENTKK